MVVTIQIGLRKPQDKLGGPSNSPELKITVHIFGVEKEHIIDRDAAGAGTIRVANKSGNVSLADVVTTLMPQWFQSVYVTSSCNERP